MNSINRILNIISLKVSLKGGKIEMMKGTFSKTGVLLTVVILVVVGLFVFYVWQQERKLKEVTSSEIKTAEESAPPEGIVWDVPKGTVDPGVEREIKKAIYNDPFFISGGKELESQGEFFSLHALKIEGGWAIIQYTARYKNTGEFVPTGPGFVLLRKVNQYWERADSKERFCRWLPLVPESILSSDTKVFDLDFCEQEE